MKKSTANILSCLPIVSISIKPFLPPFMPMLSSSPYKVIKIAASLKLKLSDEKIHQDKKI